MVEGIVLTYNGMEGSYLDWWSTCGDVVSEEGSMDAILTRTARAMLSMLGRIHRRRLRHRLHVHRHHGRSLQRRGFFLV